MYEHDLEQPELCHKWFRNKGQMTHKGQIRQQEVNPIIKQDHFGLISCEMWQGRDLFGGLH